MRKILIPAAVAVIVCCAGGCRTHYPVEIPRTLRDTVVAVRLRSDTFFVRDSVSVERQSDTVYHTRTRTIYRSRTVHDTLTHTMRDTVSVAVQVPSSGSTAEGLRIPWWAVAGVLLIAASRIFRNN